MKAVGREFAEGKPPSQEFWSTQWLAMSNMFDFNVVSVSSVYLAPGATSKSNIKHQTSPMRRSNCGIRLAVANLAAAAMAMHFLSNIPPSKRPPHVLVV